LVAQLVKDSVEFVVEKGEELFAISHDGGVDGDA
jgi:hypothetical protein